MRTKSILVVLICAALVAGGCGTTAKFMYPVDAKALLRISNSPRTDLTVAIEPFVDFRGYDNSALFALYLIPLMPYGWGDYDRPDGARMFVTLHEYQMNVPEDLAKATAISLKASGLFKDAFFSYGGSTSSSADIIVRGEVKKLQYNGKLISYGLSVIGPGLWLLGLPAGYSTNWLEFEMKFINSKTGKVLMRYPVAKEWGVLQGLYYHCGHDCRGFAILMQEAMNELIKKLNSPEGRAVMTVQE